MDVTVRFFAAARAASGIENLTITLPDGATLDDLENVLTSNDGPGNHSEMERVLARSSYLCNEIATTERTRQLPQGSTIDVLPPFAGG
ncbi:MoaD/ThiS family protein [Jongsikchunia kroppenstedtii]|uniref:MoaD/ThiS family protein n=1 Tax=Jongsikchunia kroppenstedtii TaxID=1121721 RepID=UPI00039E5DEB|nr:MoaD/ThiS family protein [Jongsikchunia kroppenstedtii]